MADLKYEFLTNSRFFVEIKFADSKQEIDGYFMECQGFKRSQDVITATEVTPQKWGSKDADAKWGRVLRTKLPGNSKCENIILKRGLCISDTFWRWFIGVEEGEWGGKQRQENIFLIIYDQKAESRARFCCSRAWPVSYKISDLKSSGTEFELEEIELAVEDFFRTDLNGNDLRLKQ
jgi:phage tail-like protein